VPVWFSDPKGTESDAWVDILDVASGQRVAQLPIEAYWAESPFWSADGRWIGATRYTFSEFDYPSERREVVVAAADGTGVVRALADGEVQGWRGESALLYLSEAGLWSVNVRSGEDAAAQYRREDPDESDGIG
jgi:hypothetical protein